MGIKSLYRDLLWDFVYEGTGEKSSVKLRVFPSEQEMFEARWETPFITFSHIYGWLKSSMPDRADWKKTGISKEMLIDIGHQLWEVIPYEAKQPLLEATPDNPCRLKISSNSSTIDDLPWEWLNDGDEPPFSLRPETRMARSVPVRLVQPPMSIEPPLRVLLVLTNPKDERLLDGQREIQAIRPALDQFPYALTVLWEPTWDALTMALKEGPHILHYIGHAGIDHGEGNLILHDDRNCSYWISGAQLSSVLPMTVRLLCLSTCFTTPNYKIQGLSRFAHTGPQNWLPTAIVNRYPVSELGVQTFWFHFYSALAEHRGNVNEAFQKAQKAVEAAASDQIDWGGFSLVIRDRSGEVLRLVEKEAHSPERFAEEAQAQLLSVLANDLAERLKSYGVERPEMIQKRFDEEASAAEDLADKLFGEG